MAIKITGITKSDSVKRWNQLLNDKRERDTLVTKSIYDKRNPFENDYSRLISSAPIRRLQDKTQVFPLEKSDFIRTRLTHSLEVSSIAKSIGKSIEKILIEEKYLDEKKDSEISMLLTNSGLVHDLGNPPFGHFGEKAIQDFFYDLFREIKQFDFSGKSKTISKSKLEGYKKIKKWTDLQKNDFLHFDGNVQTLRILSRLYFFGDENGYNLTYPTLSSVIKYPRDSTKGNKSKEDSTDICDKKFGYFISEKSLFDDINKTLKLNGQRHPVTFLLEAADDIAYAAADIEDGVKLGKLNFENILSIFKDAIKENPTAEEDKLIKYFEKVYLSIPNNKSIAFDLAIQKFRVYTQTFMINSIIKEFLDNYSDILNGKYKYELIEQSDAKRIRGAFKTISKNVYSDRGIIETELAGYKVIQGLLKEYINACFEEDFNNQNKGKNGRLYNTVSSSYRYLFENFKKEQTKDELYNKFQLITDFISGMTDHYALELYQRISGISL